MVGRVPLASSGEKLGVAAKCPGVHQTAPFTKRDWAPKVPDTNDEKPSVNYWGSEVIKVTIFHED